MARRERCREDRARDDQEGDRILSAPSGFRRVLVASWLLLVVGGLYLYVFHRDAIHHELQGAFSLSVLSGCVLYLLLGCVRGFTLIPSTYLVLAAVAFLPPAPLLALTLVGILISSASIYLFAEALHLDEVLERRHKARIARLKGVLQRHELPIIIGWSFFPLAPTDVICYVCGVLAVDFKTFLFGVCVGEGTICALYIFLGDYLLRLVHLRA